MNEIDRDTVTLAYRLILGYDPASAEVAERIAAETGSITKLRSRLMLDFDSRRQAEMLRVMDFLYGSAEARERDFARQMDSFFAMGAEIDAEISAIIAKREDQYTKFHQLRFFDQLRAIRAIRAKRFGSLAEINVLDIGVMAVSGMYQEAVDGLRLDTCDHPRRNEHAASQKVLSEFYPIDLETEALHQKFPELVGKYHAILFCEVLEHLKISPTEILGDLKRLLVPGGMIYLTTPNGMGYGSFLAYFEGRSPVAKYSRTNRASHLENFIHVREYTMREMVEHVEAAGLKIRNRAFREFFKPDALWPNAYMAGKSLLTFVLETP